MDENWEELDVKCLINSIKLHPEVWNIYDEDYHCRLSKKNAWLSISRAVIVGFDRKDNKTKNEICQMLMKKWKNIRDSYLKSLRNKTKSGQDANGARRYVYARLLTFLRADRTSTATHSNFNCNNKENVEVPRQSLKQEHQKESEELPCNVQTSVNNRNPEFESTLVDFVATPSSILAEPNADKFFFESLISYIKDFTEDQKLEFRCEILNTIRRMKMSSPPQHNGSTSSRDTSLNIPIKKSKSSNCLLQVPIPESSRDLAQMPHASNYLFNKNKSQKTFPKSTENPFNFNYLPRNQTEKSTCSRPISPTSSICSTDNLLLYMSDEENLNLF